MEWKTAFEEIKQLSADSSFGIVSTFSVERDLIDTILNLKRLNRNLLLFLDDGEQFVYPYSNDYKIITKQQLPTLDSDRNLHLKLYLFGKKDTDGSFLLNCLVGSCNVTGSGVLRNIEFWGSTNGRFNLPITSDYANLIDLFEDSKVDPSLASLEENCTESNGDLILAPAIDLLWRLVRDSNGLESGIEFGRSSCLSDMLVKKPKNQNALFVHSFGDNSLKNAIHNMIAQSLHQCQNQVILYLISPYYNWPCLDWIIGICESALGNNNIKVEIRLLTDYPPDYQEKYLTESFDSLDNLAIKDKRITFAWKFWTNASEVDVGSIILDQNIRKISSAFIHGKAFVINNDDQAFEAIIGSPNLTSAAISLRPTTNLEGAIWERESSRAKSVFNELTVFWNAAIEPTEAMMEQLKIWKDIREDIVLDLKVWIDAKEAIKRYIQAVTTKNGERLPSRNISTEELDDVVVALKISSNAPKVNLPNVKCVWLPNLDSKLRTEDVWGQGSSLCPEFKLSSQPISKLFYKIAVPTRLLRETSAQIKATKDGKILIDKTFLTQETYAYAISGKTSHGWVELDDYIENNSSIQFNSKDAIAKSAVLRVYDKQIERELSVGWDYVTITKKRSSLSIDKACICPSALCFLLKENSDNKTAAILPESIELSFEQTIQSQLSDHFTNSLSERPYQSLHSFRFLTKNPLLQRNLNKQVSFPVNVRFLDENYLFRRKSDLYANLEHQALIGDPKTCSFNNLVLELNEYSSKLVIRQFPLPNKVVDNAPITLELNTNFLLDSDLSTNIKSITLHWEMLSWGKSIKGEIIEQGIFYPSVKFILTPEMFAKALGFDFQKLSFEGKINVEFVAKLSTGWLIPLKKISIGVSKSESFVKSLFSPATLWKTVNTYTRPNKTLLNKINQIIYSEVSKFSQIGSFDSFLSKLTFGFEFEPGTYGNKAINCQGFSIPKTIAEFLIDQIAEVITQQFSDNYSIDKSNPSLPKETLEEQSRASIISSLRRTTLQVEEGIVIFPNLILRKLGLDPMV